MIPTIFKGVKLRKPADNPTVNNFSTPVKTLKVMITRQYKMPILAILFLFGLLGLSAHPEVQLPTQAETNNRVPSIFDALLQDDIVEVTIETDLVELIDNRKREDYQPAVFTFEDKQGGTQSIDMKVKPRGKFRRRVCDFPPVTLKFPKSRLANYAMNPTFNKLKLVTHCIDDKSAGKENVMREYLIYKMYQELTAQSYRVQLVELTYVDSKKKLNKIKRYGFIIEDTDEMAARAGGSECECLNAHPSTIDARAENLMAAFQYMIGNEDWSVVMLRNIKLVQPKDGSPLVPVPYDFDFAGMVDAPYAIPNSNYGLTSIKDRIYLGHEIDDEAMRRMLQFLTAKRPALEQMIDDFKPMKRSARREMLAYLDNFYTNIDQITKGTAADLQSYMKNNPIPADSGAPVKDTMGK
jgi:hypothetical protein